MSMHQCPASCPDLIGPLVLKYHLFSQPLILVVKQITFMALVDQLMQKWQQYSSVLEQFSSQLGGEGRGGEGRGGEGRGGEGRGGEGRGGRREKGRGNNV